MKMSIQALLEQLNDVPPFPSKSRIMRLVDKGDTVSLLSARGLIENARADLADHQANHATGGTLSSMHYRRVDSLLEQVDKKLQSLVKISTGKRRRSSSSSSATQTEH